MQFNGTNVSLPQLRTELAAAGIVVPSLGTYEEGSTLQIHTYDQNGSTVDLPPAASAVLAAHVPPLAVVGYIGRQTIERRVITTGTTPADLFRATLAPLTAYSGVVHLVGVDAGNGAVRVIRATVVAKRLNNGALLVGTPVVLASHADTGATTWTITPSVSGNDFIVTVTGAAGRTVNWFFRIDVDSFTPGGQS
jgi:hypothetical protein